MSTTLKQLAQIQPTVTTPTTLYSPASAGITAVIRTICVCNTGTTTSKVSIYHESPSTGSPDGTHAIVYQRAIAPGSTLTFEFLIAIGSNTDLISVQADAANQVTFTAYGAEQT